MSEFPHHLEQLWRLSLAEVRSLQLRGYIVLAKNNVQRTFQFYWDDKAKIVILRACSDAGEVSYAKLATRVTVDVTVGDDLVLREEPGKKEGKPSFTSYGAIVAIGYLPTGVDWSKVPFSQVTTDLKAFALM